MTKTLTVSGPAVGLVIDGRSVEVAKGTTVLEAATDNSIYIPTLCYVKKLLPIGSCRVCSVEIDGVEGPVMSCITPVTEGMSVTTVSDALSEHRKKMIQFILVNHPLDCPVCERSGECSLQDKTYEFGVTDQEFSTAYSKKVPVVDWGVIRYDGNLCIMCERCVKICREVQGANALVIDGTGYDAKINTTDGKKLDCDFCGQCLAVCPVGALNSGIVLSVRSWEVTKTQSVCPHCAVGCSYHINVKKGRIVRVTSDDNIGVNQGNLCAKGRFGFEAFQNPDRIMTPLVRKGVRLEPAAWNDALRMVSDRLKAIVKKHGIDSVAVIASERMSNEDAYILQKVFRQGLSVNRIDTMSNMINPDLNSGLFDFKGPLGEMPGYDQIDEAGSFLFFGCDAGNENPVIANMVRMVMRDKATPLYIANARNTSDFFPSPDLMAQYKYGTETKLVAALINSLVDINCGGVDPGALSDKVSDPAKLVESSKSVKLDEAAGETGVDSKDIERLAKAIAQASKPLLFIGKEIHDHPMSSDIIRALSNLMTLASGSILKYREYANTQGVNDMGLAPKNLPGYLKADEANSANIFQDLAEKSIKAVFIAGADPVVHYPDGGFVAESIRSAEFVVATESFMTETANLADVVLPSCSQPERDGTQTNNEGRPQLIGKAVEPMGESKPEWEIFQGIGKILGMDLNYHDAREITDEIADTVRGYEGLTYSQLSWESRLVDYPVNKGKAPGYDFNSTPLVLSQNKDFPYTVLIGDSLFHLDSLSYHSPALNGIEPRAFVEISPEDAEKSGVSDGDDAVVESKRLSINVKVRVTGRSPNGIVFIPKNFENAPALQLSSRENKVTYVKVGKAR